MQQDDIYLNTIKRWRIHCNSIESKRSPEVFNRLLDLNKIQIIEGYYEIMLSE